MLPIDISNLIRSTSNTALIPFEGFAFTNEPELTRLSMENRPDKKDKAEKADSSFKNCQHSDGVLLRLNEMRKDSQLCDVILLAGDQKFNAHKNVLSAASLYFLAMFSGYFPEIDKREIVLNDVDPDCFKIILDYIYTAQLLINHANVQSLLATASFLQIDWVEERCCDFIVKAIDSANCLGVKKFGENHSFPRLVDVANEYISRHFLNVARGEEFLSLPFEEFRRILENAELYIYDEEALLSSIIKWIEHYPTERQQHLSQLVSRLHPACVSKKIVRSFSMLHEDKECHNWVESVDQCVGKWEWNVFVLDKMGRKTDFGRLDLATSNMTPLAPLPEEAFALSLACNKHFLYVQGGCVGRSRRTCYYYNVYRNKWLNMTPMREPRSHHRSLILDNYIYAIGGNGSKGSLKAVECMDLETGQTMSIEPLLSQRSSMGAVVCERCLYVMGGETDHKSLSSMERFDPRVGVWESMPKLNLVNSYCTAAITDNYIYCCEGLGSSMERFELRSKKWEMIEFTADRSECKDPTRYLSCLARGMKGPCTALKQYRFQGYILKLTEAHMDMLEDMKRKARKNKKYWERPEYRREFFELFSIGNDLYSVSSEEITRYYPSRNRWENIYFYPHTRDWDTAAAMELVNDTSVVL